MIELVDVRLDHPRGGKPLVIDANLEVKRGEVVLIVGAAGVGTSRLVAASLGEVQASAGRIEVLGRDVAKLRRASLRLLRRRVGVVPQDLCLLEDRSAQLNVMLPLEIDGIPRSISIVRAGEVLDLLGLDDEASLPVDCLSAAERQRVAVARALVRKPDLVVADHPTSTQDAEGAELVCAALAQAAIKGAAVIVLGREPMLRAIAERAQWRQLALVEGKLLPLSAFAPTVLDEMLAAETALQNIQGSVPTHAPTPLPLPMPAPLAPAAQSVSGDADVDTDIPNVLPFPISARTAGVA